MVTDRQQGGGRGIIAELRLSGGVSTSPSPVPSSESAQLALGQKAIPPNRWYQGLLGGPHSPTNIASALSPHHEFLASAGARLDTPIGQKRQCTAQASSHIRRRVHEHWHR
jgi:hypothetical protein